jgi:hypothetical protein
LLCSSALTVIGSPFFGKNFYINATSGAVVFFCAGCGAGFSGWAMVVCSGWTISSFFGVGS